MRIFLLVYQISTIEQSGFTLKCKIKQSNFKDMRTLSSRIIEASKAVSVELSRNFIHHPVSQFSNCLMKYSISHYTGQKNL